MIPLTIDHGRGIYFLRRIQYSGAYTHGTYYRPDSNLRTTICYDVKPEEALLDWESAQPEGAAISEEASESTD
jgi:hypothetical protein